MLRKIKYIIKPYLPKSFIKFLGRINCIKADTGTNYIKLLFGRKVFFVHPSKEEVKDYVRQMVRIFRALPFRKIEGYLYPYDKSYYREIPQGTTPLASITVDFGTVLNSDLIEIKNRLSKCKDKSFARNLIMLVGSIEKLWKKYEHKTRFKDIIHHKPASFDEAIQKLLFYDALFWQARHNHIGLGRLDYILYPYFHSDISSGVITMENAKQMIYSMLLVLGNDTKDKSLAGMVGDDGQYILLGGIGPDKKNIDNELTELFLEIFKDYHSPDPKLILRVNSNTSEKIWDKAVACVCNGNGSPLFMNESLIMKNMASFGYSDTDVWNLGTSACWEPLIIGKSFDQNNPLPSISVAKSLNDVILSCKGSESFDEIILGCKEEISKQINQTAHDITFDVSPLFSLFFDDCIQKERDFSKGGARYSFHGLQVVGLPNLVNSLLSIKELVFEKKVYTISDCREIILSDFANDSGAIEAIKSVKLKFGQANKDVISLTNDIMDSIERTVSNLTINANKVKIGFSSPSYINCGKELMATMDGRRNGQPLSVHISPVSTSIDIAEILDFASSLNYGGCRLNGNVVDYIIPGAYMREQEKFKYIIQDSIEKGIFELQLNVLDKTTLIDAKIHPEKYPNLIVRVWGYSAYFNDLPEEYKDNLINRAIHYEVA